MNSQPLGHDFPLVLSVERSIKFTSLHFGYKKNVRSCINYFVSLNLNLNLFTLVLENLYKNTLAQKSVGDEFPFF